MAFEAGGIGVRLRAGREKLGLTVLQAAEKLHLDARILESLESENFEALGAPVYARGHLRHYAELVGESSVQLNELYSSNSSRPGQPDLTRIAKAPPAESNKLILPALVVLAVFAIAGAVWWVLSLSTQKGKSGQASVLEQPIPVPAADSPGNGSPGAAPASVAGAPGSAAKPPGMGAAAQKQAAAAATPAAAETPAHTGKEQQVTLKYSADSWTEVYDAGGARLYYDVGAANSVRTVSGIPPLKIVLGNASGVVVEVNGHNTPIAKLTKADGSAQFLINKSGRAVRARPSDGG
jgi:cytoskeleton protein RodZ